MRKLRAKPFCVWSFAFEFQKSVNESVCAQDAQKLHRSHETSPEQLKSQFNSTHLPIKSHQIAFVSFPDAQTLAGNWKMSNKSGTIGRTNRGLSLTSNQLRRQRSSEWQQNASSSEEENDRINGSRVNTEVNIDHRKNSFNSSASRDSSVLAQLIAQTQQLSSSESSTPIKTNVKWKRRRRRSKKFYI